MSNKDLFEYKIQILLDEWKMVEANIGRFDRIIFVLRGWALALTTAGVAFAYTNEKAGICYLLLVPVLFFWVFDALFKSFQRKFTARFGEIESYLASDKFEADVEQRSFQRFVFPLTSKAFSGRTSLGKRFSEIVIAGFLHNVWLFYSALILALCVSYSIIEIGI